MKKLTLAFIILCFAGLSEAGTVVKVKGTHTPGPENYVIGKGAELSWAFNEYFSIGIEGIQRHGFTDSYTYHLKKNLFCDRINFEADVDVDTLMAIVTAKLPIKGKVRVGISALAGKAFISTTLTGNALVSYPIAVPPWKREIILRKEINWKQENFAKAIRVLSEVDVFEGEYGKVFLFGEIGYAHYGKLNVNENLKRFNIPAEWEPKEDPVLAGPEVLFGIGFKIDKWF